ncbi:hypothetical protein IKG05_00365 [Candidatus Saccharibacteria bacterium]|nr:hypothetical protein [Candidatus Saccharibacteria bacterium]
MSKKKKNNIAWIVVLVAIIVSAVAVVAVMLNSGSSSDIVVSGEGEVVGLKCKDDKLTHIVLTHGHPTSFTNEIVANFQNDKLTSIMYQYDGVYGSEKEVEEAEAFAAADYNTILAKNYGVDTNIFSHVFVKDGNELRLTINGKADKVNSKVASYFMLEQSDSFPKTLTAMRKAYESVGFSCETTK